MVWDSLVGNFRGPIPSGTVFKRAGALYRCPEGHFTRCWNATDRTRQPLQGLDQVSAATLATTYPANDERCLVGYAIGCYEDKEHTRYMTPEEAYKNDYYEDFGPHNIGDNRTGVNPDEIFGYSSACNQQGDARGIITLNYAAEDRVYIPPDGVCRRSSPGVGGVPDYAHGSSYSLSEGGAVPSTAAAWASVAPSPADGYEVTHYKPEVWCAWDVPPHVSTHWSQLNTIQGPACKQHVWSDYEQKRRVQGTELDHETLLIATGDGHASVYVGDMAQTIPVPLFEVDPTHLDGAESGFDISSWIHGTSNTLGTNYRPEMARRETVGVSVRSAAPMMLEQICENHCGSQGTRPDGSITVGHVSFNSVGGGLLTHNGQCDDAGPGFQRGRPRRCRQPVHGWFGRWHPFAHRRRAAKAHWIQRGRNRRGLRTGNRLRRVWTALQVEGTPGGAGRNRRGGRLP